MTKIDDDIPPPMTIKVLRALKRSGQSMPTEDGLSQLSTYSFAKRVLINLEVGQSYWVRVPDAAMATRLSMSYNVAAGRLRMEVTTRREKHSETDELGVRVWRVA